MQVVDFRKRPVGGLGVAFQAVDVAAFVVAKRAARGRYFLVVVVEFRVRPREGTVCRVGRLGHPVLKIVLEAVDVLLPATVGYAGDVAVFVFRRLRWKAKRVKPEG